MPFCAETFIAKTCSMFHNLEENWIDLLEDCECELIAASGMLEQLHERLKHVRRGECDDDLMALREQRIAALGDQRKSEG